MSRSNLPQFGLAIAIGAAIGIAIFASQDEADPAEGGDGGGVAAPELVGDYVGQVPPGGTPEIFAPGLITTGIYTRDVAMTPDGVEERTTVVAIERNTKVMEPVIRDPEQPKPEFFS